MDATSRGRERTSRALVDLPRLLWPPELTLRLSSESVPVVVVIAKRLHWRKGLRGSRGGEMIAAFAFCSCGDTWTEVVLMHALIASCALLSVFLLHD